MIIPKVKELRKNSGYTQEELANILGVSRQTIISIEKGGYEPTLTLAFKIAEVFQVRIDEVFSLEKSEA
ncbi:MAG: helix-turn-helix transcriptional regulator [Culicoidibacterales bacterium]